MADCSCPPHLGGPCRATSTLCPVHGLEVAADLRAQIERLTEERDELMAYALSTFMRSPLGGSGPSAWAAFAWCRLKEWADDNPERADWFRAVVKEGSATR